MPNETDILRSMDRQAQSPLFNKLPAELRLLVYGHVFSKWLRVHWAAGCDPLRYPWLQKEDLVTLFTCKRFRVEAKDFLCGEFHFYWHMWNGPRTHYPRRDRLQKIRHLHLSLDVPCTFQAIVAGKGPLDIYKEQVAEFLDLFDRGSQLKSLDIEIREYRFDPEALRKR